MSKSMAIIGAGMAGLAAARTLARAGVNVTVFEKSRGVGGRVATRRIETTHGVCIVDTGAQILKTDGTELGNLIHNELPTDELVAVNAPIRPYDAANGKLLPPDPERDSESKWAYQDGMTTLAKLLARDAQAHKAEIFFNTRINRLVENRNGVLLVDENGQEQRRFDSVIVTAPTPQVADLLANSQLLDAKTNQSRIDALRAVSYKPCLSILLGYAAPVPLPPAYALLATQRDTPLLWLAFEAAKGPSRAPNGQSVLIAQLGPDYSREHYDAPDTKLIADTLGWLRPLFGSTYDAPLWSQVKRWRYSQPLEFADFATVNSDPQDSRIVVCGDGLRPERGRVQQAYASGLEAARFLL